MTSRVPLAIVGMACRIPGATGLDAFWNALEAGRAPFEPLPPDRFDAAQLASELPERLRGPVEGGLLEGSGPDWRALRLPPAQVERMHRMERAALLTMCEAMADAGIERGAGPAENGQIWIAASTLGSDPRVDHMRRIRRFELADPIAGALASRAPAEAHRVEEIVERLFDEAAPPIHPDSFTTSASLIAGRVANLYDFRGGHAAVDVGPASSLAALQRAAEELQSGRCDVALVCGISPLVTSLSLLAFAWRGWLGEGAPRPFDPTSSGTLLGEGCAAMVMRRADDVRGVRTYAILEALASASMPRHAGAEGLRESTRLAAARALELAGIGPTDVRHVESRACGVPALDEPEALGLSDAYLGAPGQPFRVSSSVPNAGFLQGASGMLAVVKAALALSRGSWPAQPGAAGELCAREDAAAPAPPPFAHAGVSDAGPGPLAYHALLSAPGARHRSWAAPRAQAPADTAVAIVGAGLLVPRASDTGTFWRNVLARVDALGDLPRSRFDIDRLVGSSVEVARALRTRLAGIVEVPPSPAARLGLPAGHANEDPAIAMGLHCAEQALREAGFRPGLWNPERVRVIFGQLPLRVTEVDAEKRVLFAGHLALAAAAMREAGLPETEVARIAAEARRRFDEECPRLSAATLDALSGAICASRVAAAFDFRGGALSIDAACASSLAALQAGTEALRRGDADIVVAGGIAYNLLPEYYVTLSLLGALSPRGVCPFHRSADGFVPAEGAGAVVLKRLADARAEGDAIYAVIQGHGFSSDGRGLSIFAPSTAGQQRAIRRALESAGIAPGDVDFVEAHGTATHLGDRTEMESYAAVYGNRDLATPLAIGAVKSQVGHASSAGGIVGVIKAALALRERRIPPNNGDGDLDPELPFGRLPIDLALEARHWPVPPGRTRRAAVSAFGLGGVNHHVILEEAPCSERAPRAATFLTAPPASGQRADRFVAELTPLSLPDRAPLFPLRGRRLLVLAAEGDVFRAVATRLAGRGATVERLDPGAIDTREAAANAVEALATRGPLDGVLDLSTFRPEPGLASSAAPEIAAELERLASRTFGVAAAFYPHLEAAVEHGACFVAVTALGGELGLTGQPAGDLAGAFFLGFAQALKQELPGIVCKVVDFDPLASPDLLAERLVGELEDGNDRVAVGYAGRRFVANLRRAPFAEGAPALRPIGEGDVFVFSGGGRGVVFECACALARRGARVVVSGRTQPPDPGLPWLALDDRAFANFRAAELARRRGEPGLTPGRFAREFEPMARARELHRNLERARLAGLALSYEVCDITDPASVSAMMARVRERHGRIDGIGHGAMVEASGSLPRKAPAAVERTLATKVLGLVNLLDAAHDDPLRVAVAFGSGAARFGNRGQTDYAGANALMAAWLQARAGLRSRPVRCVTIDWPAWESVGAAADADVSQLIRSAGATTISVEEGVHWFLSELAQGGEGHVAVLEEKMLHGWPFLGSSAEGVGERAVELDDRGVPLVPGRWPMVDVVLAREPGHLALERRLDMERDLFLGQHLLRGTPILPATFACEMLVEAAALACPGFSVAEVSDVRMESAAKLLGGAPLTLRVFARVVEEGPECKVLETESRSVLLVRGRELTRVHHRARIRMARGPRPAPERIEIAEGYGPLRARSFFHMGDQPLGRGPLFSLAAWIQVDEHGAVGTALPARPRDIFRDTAWPRFEIDPILLDTALQVAGSWDGFREGYYPVPLGFGRLVPGRPLRPGEHARVRARLVEVAHPDAFFDIQIAGPEGDHLLQVARVHLRRIAQGDRALEPAA